MDFRIIPLSKRPAREMVLRRDVDDDGTDMVVAETFVPRDAANADADWNYIETVRFERNSIAQLRSYIDGYSEANAKAFYLRAKAEAERNTERPDPPTPQQEHPTG